MSGSDALGPWSGASRSEPWTSVGGVGGGRWSAWLVVAADRVHTSDGEEAPGGKDRHVPGCGRELRYCFEFDAAYCPWCDGWTERSCSDAGCDYCASRPARPSGAHWSAW